MRGIRCELLNDSFSNPDAYHARAAWGALAIRQADFGLTQLADNLLEGVSLPWHPDLLSNRPSLTFGLDQVS